MSAPLPRLLLALIATITMNHSMKWTSLGQDPICLSLFLRQCPGAISGLCHGAISGLCPGAISGLCLRLFLGYF